MRPNAAVQAPMASAIETWPRADASASRRKRTAADAHVTEERVEPRQHLDVAARSRRAPALPTRRRPAARPPSAGRPRSMRARPSLDVKRQFLVELVADAITAKDIGET